MNNTIFYIWVGSAIVGIILTIIGLIKHDALYFIFPVIYVITYFIWRNYIEKL